MLEIPPVSILEQELAQAKQSLSQLLSLANGFRRKGEWLDGQLKDVERLCKKRQEVMSISQ